MSQSKSKEGERQKNKKQRKMENLLTLQGFTYVLRPGTCPPRSPHASKFHGARTLCITSNKWLSDGRRKLDPWPLPPLAYPRRPVLPKAVPCIAWDEVSTSSLLLASCVSGGSSLTSLGLGFHQSKEFLGFLWELGEKMHLKQRA